MNAQSMPSGIVYNLSFDKVLQVYLPSVFIAQMDQNGALGFMEKKGTPEILESYGHYQSGSIHQPLLAICEKLSPKMLQQQFINSKRLTVSKALEDPNVKKAILGIVNRKMHQFFSHIMENKFPICLNIERSISLEKLRLKPIDQTVEPILYFKKTSQGIEYSLAIRDQNLQWYPCERNVIVVCDHPGWIIENSELFRLNHINGNKLKPFLQKKTVKIPNHLTHEYLKKFVKDIIAKASVKAEGFEIRKFNHRPKATLRPTKNFISNEWMLELLFQYGEETFQHRSVENSRTRLQFPGDQAVQFTVTERQNAVEKMYTDKIAGMGLMLNNFDHWTLNSNTEDPYELLLWLQSKHKSFAKINVNVKLPDIDDHALSKDSPLIQISQVENNDWFDIYGVITVGKYQIPFRELIDYIRNENRICSLPDGTCFIIPIEWMTKYQGLARWAKVNDDGVRILRSQFSLLEEPEQDLSPEVNAMVNSDIVYTPSDQLNATLRHYQLQGIRWLISHQIAQLGCCLADDMGLGKTVQTLSALLYAKENLFSEQKPNAQAVQINMFEKEHIDQLQSLCAIIIMPASLIFNWYSEIKKFVPFFHVKSHIGTRRTQEVKELKLYDLVLTSYQTALRDIDLLSQVDWSYIVLDESQYIKNHKSRIFSAIQKLPSQYKLSLSGTPIENSLSDLWAQMQFINPDILGAYSFFKKHFQIPIEKNKDEKMLEELKKLTQPYILRRTKEEVLKDLPEKTEQVIYCEMSKEQKSLYEKEKSAARNLILKADVNDPQIRIQVLTTLLRLRQLANHPSLYKEDYKHGSGKYEVLNENIRTVVRSKHKALLFSSFTGHLDIISNFLKESAIPFVTLTGQTAQKERQRAVQKFQGDKSISFFLISIKAGGTGLNLTAADYVFLLDPWWNPFVENQAIARAHRIGSNHQLTVLRYITKDTIEEKIMILQQKKRDLSEDILGINEAPEWNKEELGFLLD